MSTATPSGRKLLAHLAANPRTLAPGPTTATVYTASQIAPGGFHLTRLDGRPLTPADRQAEQRAHLLQAAFSADPARRSLLYTDGAYLHAVRTSAPTPPEHINHLPRRESRLEPGPRGGAPRYVTYRVCEASTTTVTTIPLDYRTPVTTTHTYAPCTKHPPTPEANPARYRPRYGYAETTGSRQY